MVVIEHLLGSTEILLDPALLAPGDRQHPVEVVAHHRGLGRHRRHRTQLLELGQRLLARFLRELRRLDLLLVFGSVVLALAVARAEFALDRLHLFVEVILALGALHLRLDAALDLLLDLEHRHLALHQPVDRLEPGGDIRLLQQCLLFLELRTEMPGDGIGELARRHVFGQRRHRLVRDVAIEFGVTLELLGHSTAQRRDRRGIALGLGDNLGTRLEIGVIFREIRDPYARLALHKHLHGTVGQLEKLQHIGENADTVDAVGRRFVLGRVHLAGEQDLLVLAHHRLERPHGLLTTHEKRHDHVGEDDDVAQREDGMDRAAQFAHVVFLVLATHPAPRTAAARVYPRRFRWRSPKTLSSRGQFARPAQPAQAAPGARRCETFRRHPLCVPSRPGRGMTAVDGAPKSRTGPAQGPGPCRSCQGFPRPISVLG